ncbi:hypothetical protein V5O48_016987 [Marasmius crinis-equi]|uniref:Uncharacterized protein n=1 Tax=Marasmius crinis-equi TaxID=585013 RepID=A0ABR3EQ75_9AGAR
MPARATASSFDINIDDLDDILSSPERPQPRSLTQTNPRKRRREDNDDETPDSADGNVIAVAKRLAVSQKLSGDQINELEAFLKDSALGRAGRVFITLKNIENKVNAVVTTQEAWKVSDTLKKNLSHYVAAACLSVTIQAYRNDRTTALIMQKIRDMNMELPPNFDQDMAAQSTLKRSIEDTLTQRRSGMKKAIRASAYEQLKPGIWTERQGSDCQNIFELTQKLVKGTQCHITPELCARVAIFRYAYKAYYEKEGQDYWGRVDATLQKLRTSGNNDKKQIARLVKKILVKDRSAYGLEDSYKLPEHGLPSALQADMDQRIDAADGFEGEDADEVELPPEGAAEPGAEGAGQAGQESQDGNNGNGGGPDSSDDN